MPLTHMPALDHDWERQFLSSHGPQLMIGLGHAENKPKGVNCMSVEDDCKAGRPAAVKNRTRHPCVKRTLAVWRVWSVLETAFAGCKLCCVVHLAWLS